MPNEIVYVECSPGYFGLDCNKLCSGHYINNGPYDYVSGFCPRGCMDGYIGGHCNICKIWTKLYLKKSLKQYIIILNLFFVKVWSHLM